jgi:hypothetical protein
MTFVYPLLLGGLLLVGIPVLLHLIMRQKPKRLPFPAMRFLLQRHRTNQRRLKLRHLLLLALRMLLLAAICLALARPKIFSERLHISTDQPVWAVMIFDTSYSMEYTVAGRNRLDEAKKRSLEVLEELPQGSRVAVLDTGEAGGEWLSASMARQRIAGLELKAANSPITVQLTPAYEMLAKLSDETDNPEEVALRFLYVFSDRTEACWNDTHVENLQRLRDRIPAPGVQTIFVDVGVDNPTHVALAELKLPKTVVAANEKMLIQATVQATGTSCDTELICRIDDKDPVQRIPVALEPGQRRIFSFDRRGLAPGMHQAEISLATKDALPSASTRFVTFEVQAPRQVLLISDNVRDVRTWKTALESQDVFKCDLTSTAETKELYPDKLAKYKAICLLNVAKPDRNQSDLWDKLWVYVQKGGGLAVIPGGNEMDPDSYNSVAAQKLMPGKLEKVVKVPEPGAVWVALSYQHSIMTPFAEWSKGGNVDFLQPGAEPGALRYWEVTPKPDHDAFVIVSYADKKPALVETLFNPEKVHGRVLLFTTPLDDTHIGASERNAAGEPTYWNNYNQGTSFYLVLALETIGYLARDPKGGFFNYDCGQTVTIPVPGTHRFPTYTVQGPGLSSSEAIVPRADDQTELALSKAVNPGNFKVYGAEGGKPMAWFSLNLPPLECQLTRVPAERIEALFGPKALLPLDSKTSMHDALQNHWNQPVELLPWLMILVLLVLAVENLLANKFYRREPPEEEQTEGAA